MGIAKGVDIENIQICWCEKDVLDELELLADTSLQISLLTQVNMCQGSKKRNDEIRYMTQVARRDIMRVVNTVLLNNS